MSLGFNPKDQATMGQALKVEELVVAGSDANLFSSSGGSSYVFIREPVVKIYVGRVKVDSTNLWTEFQQANLSVVDSVALTPGGDQGAIKFTGLASVAGADIIIVKYSTK